MPKKYMGPVTAQEAELGDLALGPDHSWHQSYRNGSCTDDLPLTGEDASQRLQCLRSLQEPIEVETRQCLCLHVAAALSGERSVSKVRTEALVLRKEMLQESVDAFAYVGDAPPHVSEAEAFVRHNAHDCFYPHHEKDYRSRALFAPEFLRGTQLIVVRVSQSARRGSARLFWWGGYPPSHMRLLDLSTKSYHALFEHLEQSGRLVREVDAQGWAPFLDRTGASPFSPSSLRSLPSSSDPMSCWTRKVRRLGTRLSRRPYAGPPLSERPVFSKESMSKRSLPDGLGGPQVWRSSFRTAPPVEYFQQLIMGVLVLRCALKVTGLVLTRFRAMILRLLRRKLA